MNQFSKRTVAALIAVLVVLATSPIFSAQADRVVPANEIQNEVNHAAGVRQ